MRAWHVALVTLCLLWALACCPQVAERPAAIGDETPSATSGLNLFEFVTATGQRVWVIAVDSAAAVDELNRLER